MYYWLSYRTSTPPLTPKKHWLTNRTPTSTPNKQTNQPIWRISINLSSLKQLRRLPLFSCFSPFYCVLFVVQEEIRFTVCPELIAAMLFMECMDDNEAIIIQGYEQFSETSGYGDSLTYVGDYKDMAQVIRRFCFLTSLTDTLFLSLREWILKYTKYIECILST